MRARLRRFGPLCLRNPAFFPSPRPRPPAGPPARAGPEPRGQANPSGASQPSGGAHPSSLEENDRMPRAASMIVPILGMLLGPCCAALAAEDGDALHLDGGELSILWVLPFVGILLSIALFPLLAPSFWHHHFGKISFAWAVAFLAPFAVEFGFQLTVIEALHTALLEYIPFIILLFALFTVTGGLRLRTSGRGTPTFNTGILAVGTALASWMGTTGAAMLLIRPLLRANAWRRRNVHVVVFFIFLVANIGGSLTPLGDPPLFLGFLKGVDFFWTAEAMLLPMLVMAIPLLIVFYLLDQALFRREEGRPPVHASGEPALRIEGKINLLLLVGVVLSVLLSGVWRPGI